MGILNKVFKKKEKKSGADGDVIEIYSPILGEIIDIADIPDEAFAKKLIGDGVGIVPTEEGNTIYAPCDAVDMSIFETNHAASFELENGLELVVHFGIDTVTLNGRGFERLTEVSEGSVKKGDRLIKYDLDYIVQNAKSHKTPVIISSMEMVESIEKKTGRVRPGDLLMRVILKK